MTFVRRYLFILGWPVVIWVESAEVVAMFKENALKEVAEHDNSASFYAADVHRPAAAAGPDKKHTVTMSEYAGVAFISDLGDSTHAIVLVNYDRGNVKYDPEFAQDRLLSGASLPTVLTTPCACSSSSGCSPSAPALPRPLHSHHPPLVVVGCVARGFCAFWAGPSSSGPSQSKSQLSSPRT